MAAEAPHSRVRVNQGTLDPLLVDEREARRLLGGLSTKTLFNLRRAGALPFIKIGSRVMYDLGELRHFIERHKGGAA
jgi:helix-turn-helix protein